MRRLLFIDIETTGTDPIVGHEVWEAAVVDESGAVRWDHWLPVQRLEVADPSALAVGGFHERHPQGYNTTIPPGAWLGDAPEDVLAERVESLARLLHGAVLVGIGVYFDELFLRCLLRDNGHIPGWDHRLVEVRSLVAGYVMGNFGPTDKAEREAVVPPWHSDELARCVGVEPSEYLLHTALGDAQFARALYMEVMGHDAQ